MVYNRAQAANRANRSKVNKYAMCYQWTRQLFGIGASGDVDGDGDADAIDGWKATKIKHPGDRRPPRGVPVFYSGGKSGYGHAAISLGGGRIRSTDAAGRERVGTVGLDWPERVWGMKYLGWTEDLAGVKIPSPPKPLIRGYRVDRAIKELIQAKGAGTRSRQIKDALAALRRIAPLNRR